MLHCPFNLSRPSFVTCMNLGVNVINKEMMPPPPAPSYEEQYVRARLRLTDPHSTRSAAPKFVFHLVSGPLTHSYISSFFHSLTSQVLVPTQTFLII